MNITGGLQRFKGKFFECCLSSKDYPYWARYGMKGSESYKRCQHCDCEVCRKKRQEGNLMRCEKKHRCLACLNHEMREWAAKAI